MDCILRMRISMAMAMAMGIIITMDIGVARGTVIGAAEVERMMAKDMRGRTIDILDKAVVGMEGVRGGKRMIMRTREDIEPLFALEQMNIWMIDKRPSLKFLTTGEHGLLLFHF